MTTKGEKTLSQPDRTPVVAGCSRHTASVLKASFIIFLVQGMAAQFIYSAVPAFLRQAGHGPEIVSLTFLMFLPFILRFLWAPLVDQFGSAKLGHRRSWILPMQGAQVVLVGALLFTRPDNAVVVLVLSATFTAVLATQTTASGAYLLENIPQAAHSRGATVKAVASTLSGLGIGTAVLIAFGDGGWVPSLSALIVLGGTGSLVLAAISMDKGRGPEPSESNARPNFRMFRRAEVRRLFYMLALVNAAFALPFGIKAIVLVDAGLSISEIGAIGVIGGNIAGLGGAAMAYLFVLRFGPRVALAAVLLGAAVVYAVVSPTLSQQSGPDRNAAIAFVLSTSALGFGLYVAGRTLIMGVCNRRRAATELATFVSLEGAMCMVVAGVSGSLLTLLGTANLLIFGSIATAAVGFALLFSISAKQQGSSPQASTPPVERNANS